MVGLWRCDKQAMLGLEFYSDTVQPKVLLRLCGKDLLNMFYLPRLKLEDGVDLIELTKLLVAYMAYIYKMQAVNRCILPSREWTVVVQ